MANASRRSVLTALAASPLVATTPVVAGNVSDAGLIASCERAIERFRAANALTDQLDVAASKVAVVEPPEALFRRRADFQCFFGFTGSLLPDGRNWYGAPESLVHLRDARFTRATLDGATTDPATGDITPRDVPDERARARADEILAAHESWLSGMMKAEADAGYTALAQRVDAALDDAFAALVATDVSATTLAGIQAKARLAVTAYGGPERWDEDGMPDIVTAIINDILAAVR